MKLKNKKTGDIWEFDGGFSMKASRETTEKAGGRGCSLTCYAHSLAELNAEWEDAQPAEPLIKDPKARKVLREWVDLIGAERFRVNHFRNAKTTMLTSTDLITEPSIELPGHIGKDSEIYTIAELCGEEEE